MKCLFQGGGEDLVCSEHGGFYSWPLEGERVRRADGYVWRECTPERRYCVHGDVRLRVQLTPGQIEMDLYENQKALQ